MIHIRSKDELELIRKSALIVTATLTEVAAFLKPGITTQSIDAMAETFIRDHGGVPSFKNYHGYPYSLCISVNEVVVHGFPGDYVLKDGDVVSVDCGFYKDGYHGDHAFTFALGQVSDEVLRMMAITKKSLELAIGQAKANNRIGDIGFAVEQLCERENGYGVVRELVGHGIGRNMHEDPQVPNYGRRGEGKKLKEGMVLAIEPMITLGKRNVVTLEDGWTVVTTDGLPAAHFEHTTAVGKNSGKALSDFGPIEAAERANPELNAGAQTILNVEKTSA